MITECRNFFGIELGLLSVQLVKGFDIFLYNADLLSD